MSFDANDGIVFDDPESPGSPLRPSGELRAAGRIPLLVDKQWRTALLLNSPDADVDAWALFRDERQPSRAGYRRWTERYPSGSPAADAMPKASLAVPWGDFLVLGDIVWKKDPSQPLSPANAARYPHGLWFSEPGVMDSWDELEVEFVGQRDGNNRIVGMFPMEAGLLVTSPSSVFLLRGTPDDHLYEDLRVGVGPVDAGAVTFWPQAGVVAWVDARGQVWQTNGERFGRLDEPLPPYDYSYEGRRDAVGVLDGYLVVSRAGRTFCLRLGEEGRAAWTELNGPYATGMEPHAGSLYLVSADGLLRWAPEVEGLRGRRSAVSGTFGDEGLTETPLGSEVATRTLAGEDPHDTAFWHRVGLRSEGGRVLSAASVAGPYDEALRLVYGPEDATGERDLRVWPGHGPSVEATFVFEGEGDITYESVTAWVHNGKAVR